MFVCQERISIARSILQCINGKSNSWAIKLKQNVGKMLEEDSQEHLSHDITAGGDLVAIEDLEAWVSQQSQKSIISDDIVGEFS